MDEYATPVAATPLSNIPEYTVSEISGAVKRTLETNFGRVRVRGEITEYKRYPSGHAYFSLKDEGGKLAAVLFKGSFARAGLAPENGLEVIAQGRISAYGERSSYQLVVDRLEYAGIGALLARIEMLRTRLAAEGLFDPERKRALPILPSVIGLVTSESGAVIQDIRTTIARRFPRLLLLWPVPVQGEGAAARIAAAISGFDALPAGGAVPRPDVLIVARGGGSLEDLMAFNDEAVLRAVAACRIPLISAVGHETDTTLIDHVSDRRAPTPTAAAELAVPDRLTLSADLKQTEARLTGALGRLAQERRLRLGRAERGLPDASSLLGAARQRLDDRSGRLATALPNLLAMRKSALARADRLELALLGLRDARRSALVVATAHLRSALRHAVANRAATGGRVTHRFGLGPVTARLRESRARLEGWAARLESVSHRAVLSRGYALVFGNGGAPVTRAASVSPGASLRIVFQDGEIRAAASRTDPRQADLDL